MTDMELLLIFEHLIVVKFKIVPNFLHYEKMKDAIYKIRDALYGDLI